jgi:CRP/FNR family transcriptional regulator, cyclic AMP receptor protein
MNEKQFLRNVQLFAEISDRHLERIQRLCKSRTFPSGTTIVKQGEAGVGLYIIVRGKVEIRKTMEDNSELSLATHGPGEFFGEFSVIDQAPRTASVVALEETECLLLPAWDFNSLIQSHPEIALEILPVVVRRFRETNEQLLGLRSQASRA